MAAVSDLFIVCPCLQGGKGTVYRLRLDWTKSSDRTGHGSDRPSERVDAGQSTEQRREVLCTSWCD